jgi:hypothetical protein
MADQMIAYCGLVCTECPAYVATRADDMQALERIAAQWREEFNAPFTAQDCICDGCSSGSDRLCSYCSRCEVRACALERGVINCAHCDDYGCDKLIGFFEFAPAAKAKLEEIRASL